MKMGPVDGNVEEVKNILENHGLKLEDYLERPRPPLKCMYLFIPIVLFAISIILIILCTGNNVTATKLLYVFGFGSATWMAVSVQIMYKNNIATLCVSVGALIIILLAAGLMTPRETIEIIKDIRSK